MGCFSCFKPSKESKTSWKCWKGESQKSDETLRKRKKRGFCGLCGKRSLKDEDSPRKQGSTCCFFCKRTSKDEKQSKDSIKTRNPSTDLIKKKDGSRKGGKKDSSEEPSKREGKGCMSCLLCCKPKKKDKKGEMIGGKETSSTCGCFTCGCFGRIKPPSDGCLSCFRSCRPKKDKMEELKWGKEKATTSYCFFSRTKHSSEESSKRKREGCMSFFCCFKSSKKDKEEELKRDNNKVSSCACVKSSEAQSYFSCFRPSSTEAKGCLSCFKSSKKKDSGKCGDKAAMITKPSDGKACKSGCTKSSSCSCGCSCCSSSANKKVKKAVMKRARLTWRKKEKKKMHHLASPAKAMSLTNDCSKHSTAAKEILHISNGNIAARVFTYCELETATQNFASECLLGEGGLGKVYKGHLKDTNQDIAVKKLDKNGYQGNREFLIEVLMLSLLSHPNLVNLLGYCADGDERILVYDYMKHGSLQDHLLGLRPDSKPLDWNTRMKIAAGAAKGLEHLHDTANPPVIYRDLKPSNILLDDDFNPRLADFGLAKLGPVGAKDHVSTRVMGTFGYCAPEYVLTGKLTKMSDIYSFGVLLLELITGRKAMDTTRPRNEQILVEWAAPLFKDKRKFIKMTDPLLEGKFPVKALYQAVAISSMCLQEEDHIRPLIKDVVCALQFLAVPEGNSPSSSGPKHSVIKNQIPSEPQLHRSPTEKSISDSTKEEPRHSSDSDWQSCSMSRGDIEELREMDGMRLSNADPY